MNNNEPLTHAGKTALITGITGQDGAYLADLLLKKDTWYMALKEDLPVQYGAH